jgi:hypothetical protein
MSKFKVIADAGWELKEGNRVEYYNIDSWVLELIPEEFEAYLKNAKNSVKVHKAWYRWLKKNRKKYKTP